MVIAALLLLSPASGSADGQGSRAAFMERAVPEESNNSVWKRTVSRSGLL